MAKKYIYNSLGFNGENRVSTISDIQKIRAKSLEIQCLIDDFFDIFQSFSNIEGKNIKYYIIMSDRFRITNFINMFNVFQKLTEYKDVISGVEISFSSQLKYADINKLLDFLKNIDRKMELKLNISGFKCLDFIQLDLLKKSNPKVNFQIAINQSYNGKFEDNNNNDNVYDLDTTRDIKLRINDIIRLIPVGYTEVEKVLFVYKYLGKRVKYDYIIAGLDNEARNLCDKDSIYDVLFKNRGVCSGIATTFRVIMDELGIECYCIDSRTHQWNIIKINGYWYHLDLTWDLDNIKNNQELQYFLKSANFMLNVDSHETSDSNANNKYFAQKSLNKRLYNRVWAC